jgi:hypothetical protein
MVYRHNTKTIRSRIQSRDFRTSIGDLSLPPISEMWGRYGRHLSDLTNRKETPPSRRPDPTAEVDFWSPHLFKNLASDYIYYPKL